MKQSSGSGAAFVFIILLGLYLIFLLFRFYAYVTLHPSFGIFFIFWPLFLSVFYNSGKFFLREVILYFSFVMFGGLLAFGGIPYLYGPTFNESLHDLNVYNSEMLKAWAGLALFALLGFYIGKSERGKKKNKFDSLSSILSNLIGIPLYIYLRLKYKKEGLSDLKGISFSDDDGAYLTPDNLSLHTQVIGGSGVGKTNFLKHIVISKVAQNRGVIFMDFKADFEVMEWLAGLCQHFGRDDLKIFTLSDPSLSISYNPLEYGNANELTSLIMNSLTWSEEYYKNYSENILLNSLGLLVHLREVSGKKFHIGHLLSLLTDEDYRYRLLHLAESYRHISEVKKQLMELSLDKNLEKISGLVVQLKRLIYSEAGDIFTTNVEQELSLNLRDSISKGEIVYLCMNSMSLKEVASLVGKMILQDLMKEVGSIYDSRDKADQVSVVIDEFASFATPDFVHFIDKARGAGIELVLSHQSMGDLREISDNFGVRVFENTASKVIFNTLSSDDAEFFSSMIGTFQEEEVTRQVEKSIFGNIGTGLGSSRMVERFTVHPNVFKGLGRGEAVIATSKVDQHSAVVTIDKAPHIEPLDVRKFNFKERQDTGRYLTVLTEECQREEFDLSSDGVDII